MMQKTDNRSGLWEYLKYKNLVAYTVFLQHSWWDRMVGGAKQIAEPIKAGVSSHFIIVGAKKGGAGMDLWINAWKIDVTNGASSHLIYKASTWNVWRSEEKEGPDGTSWAQVQDRERREKRAKTGITGIWKEVGRERQERAYVTHFIPIA